MAEQTESGPHGRGGASSAGGVPRWVKVSAVVAVVVVLFLGVMALVAGGDHGPGRHVPSGAGDAPGASPMQGGRHDGGHERPEGGHG